MASRSGSPSMPAEPGEALPGWFTAASRSSGRPGRRAPSPAPQLVEAGVGGHPVGPGREGGSPVEAADAPGDRDERLLGGVERVGLVAGQPAAHGVDAVVVPTQERVERRSVALLGGADQRPVVEPRIGCGEGRPGCAGSVAQDPGLLDLRGARPLRVAAVDDPDEHGADRRRRRGRSCSCRPAARPWWRPARPSPRVTTPGSSGDVDDRRRQSFVGLVELQRVQRCGRTEGQHEADARLEPGDVAVVVALGAPRRAGVAVDGVGQRARRSPCRRPPRSTGSNAAPLAMGCAVASVPDGPPMASVTPSRRSPAPERPRSSPATPRATAASTTRRRWARASCARSGGTTARLPPRVAAGSVHPSAGVPPAVRRGSTPTVVAVRSASGDGVAPAARSAARRSAAVS